MKRTSSNIINDSYKWKIARGDTWRGRANILLGSVRMTGRKSAGFGYAERKRILSIVYALWAPFFIQPARTSGQHKTQWGYLCCCSTSGFCCYRSLLPSLTSSFCPGWRGKIRQSNCATTSKPESDAMQCPIPSKSTTAATLTKTVTSVPSFLAPSFKRSKS